MPIKKSALYSSLWESCNELRGGMDASQYKDYVLTLLFIKYLSDKRKSNTLVKIPEGSSFDDLVALKGNKEIGDKINKAIDKLAEANEQLKGVLNIADFNDETKLGKAKGMSDRLSKLLSIFDSLDFSSNGAEGDDLLGDAYEYLMRHFAKESGKSKGQFYTPAEVSRIMAKVIGIGKEENQSRTVYDPTCGSGSLLLKVADEVQGKITIYGQEKDVTTTSLAKMNMFLNGNPTATIAGGSSTLSDPEFKSDGELKQFDFIVANPPFSLKVWQSGFAKGENKKSITDPYGRFDDYGVPPPKSGDYAFLLHIIHSLKSKKGKGAVILPHGVLFRGNVEATIRKEVVERGYIKGIIGLPANLFYGTGIPACIIVLDKEGAPSREEIFMMDASQGFIKDGNKNRLRFRDIHKIIDVFNKRLEIEGFSRLVSLSEISDPKNDYSLSLSRYIDSNDEVDIHDLIAHLKGGIPKRDVDGLNRYWDLFTNAREALFKQSANPDYLVASMPIDQVKGAIIGSAYYQKYLKDVRNALKGWKERQELYLKSLDQKCKPREVILEISEDLLSTFSSIPIIEKYAVYEHLMKYWSEVMEDDVDQISRGGWKDAAQIGEVTGEKNKKNGSGEEMDLTFVSGKKTLKFRSDSIPPALIVHRYYADEKKIIDKLEKECEVLTQEIEELTEEHSGEEGLLKDATNDKGKLTKTGLKDCIKTIKGDENFEDEMKVLERAKSLLDQKSALESKVKSQRSELGKKIVAHYPRLDTDEIKELVVIDKWFVRITAHVNIEVERVAHLLSNRVKKLMKRYANPMPELIKQTSDYSDRVEEHLKKMGLS